MRRNIRTGLVTSLALLMLITSGCSNEIPELPPVESQPDKVEAITTTKEFTNSNYQKWFYSKLDAEKKYADTLATLTKVEGLYTISGRKQIYKDDTGNYVFISGYMPILADRGNDFDVLYTEKTGIKMSPFKTEEDKTASMNQLSLVHSLLKQDYINIDKEHTLLVNDQTISHDVVGEMLADGTYAINIMSLGLMSAPTFKFEVEGVEMKMIVNPIISEEYTVNFPIDTDYKLVVEEDTKNTYYSAKYNAETGDLFVPMVVIKHILGWECTYDAVKDIACIVTDDTLKPDGFFFDNGEAQRIGITDNANVITGIKDDKRTDETGVTLVGSKDDKLKAKDIGKPVVTEVKKPAVEVSKPPKSATSKPSTEKPKPEPTTPAPTYTNTWLNKSWVCDGKGHNPATLPPTDGVQWDYDLYKKIWFWSDYKTDLGEGGEDLGTVDRVPGEDLNDPGFNIKRD